MDRGKCALVKINLKAGGRREGIKERFEMHKRFLVSTNDNDSLISILKHRSRQVFNKEVMKETVIGCLEKHQTKPNLTQ